MNYFQPFTNVKKDCKKWPKFVTPLFVLVWEWWGI